MTYAGDISPTDTFAALQADPQAVLVDVRTSAEWAYVGVPDLARVGRDAILIEWVTYPGGARNDNFVDQLREAGIAEGQSVYFLCRSGVRSKHAAVGLFLYSRNASAKQEGIKTVEIARGAIIDNYLEMETCYREVNEGKR